MKKSKDDYLTIFFISIIGIYIFIALAFPMYAILSKSVENKDGIFIGFENYQSYFSNPALVYSIYNSLFISIITMVITISLAFVFAYALTKSCMVGKSVFRSIAMIPILVPSLLSGISLIYLFGKQGIFRDLMMGYDIYGPIGIIIAEVFYTFPHALLIIITALSIGDARLYEAAKVLRSKSIRTFFTVTLPSAKYGVISAAFVVFTLVITDFGIPKVIGGQFNVLAVDVYKQVIRDGREPPPGGESPFAKSEPESLLGDGGCLIATASYGSELAPQVQQLRELRDNTVLQTKSGSVFMATFNQFYYSFSPMIADYERENPAFKEVVKLAITPLLASLSLLQHTDIDSEYEMLGYGISIILLNMGMYIIAPAVLITKIRSFYKLQ